jgi:hypothetical protein
MGFPAVKRNYDTADTAASVCPNRNIPKEH